MQLMWNGEFGGFYDKNTITGHIEKMVCFFMKHAKLVWKFTLELFWHFHGTDPPVRHVKAFGWQQGDYKQAIYLHKG